MVTDGAARRLALGGIAATVVMGLAACGATVAGAGTSAKRAATTKPSASQISPGGPTRPAAARHVLLCTEIAKLTRMSFTRTIWPPDQHAREVLPSEATVRNVAVVRQIATALCALPTVRFGVMSCPNLAGGSYRLYFAAPGRAIPAVGIEYSGCRFVAGLGRPRTWATSKALQQALNQGLGASFRPPSPPF